MLLVLSITFVIKSYWLVCVQMTHFSSGDWKDIFIVHVIIIIKSEVSTFPIVIIFLRERVSEMFVTSYSVTYCIYIPGKLGFGLITIVQFMMSANSRIRYGLQIVFVCLYITSSHYHHCANLSVDIELMSIQCCHFPQFILCEQPRILKPCCHFPLSGIWLDSAGSGHITL